MNEEQIDARRVELQAQLARETQNQQNAARLVDTINGALQDCAFWQSKLGEETAKPKLELVRDDSFVEQGA
jgi:hypothetical protein